MQGVEIVSSHALAKQNLREGLLEFQSQPELDAILGGWQLNGIVTMLSGRPFTPVFTSADTASGRPDLISDPMQNIPEGLYYNPYAFRRPQATADDATLFGSAGRNILIGPGFQNVDLSLFKNIRLAERTKLQLRWEVFNVLNRANFQVPGFQLPTDIATISLENLMRTSSVGRSSLTSNEAREMQFAVRLTF